MTRRIHPTRFAQVHLRSKEGQGVPLVLLHRSPRSGAMWDLLQGEHGMGAVTQWRDVTPAVVDAVKETQTLLFPRSRTTSRIRFGCDPNGWVWFPHCTAFAGAAAKRVDA